MTGFPLYLLGVAIAGLATLWRPRPRLRTLFLLWAAGLVVTRILAPLLATALARTQVPDASRAALVVAVGGIGSILLLRSLLGLTLWERPFRRRTWVVALLLALAVVLGYQDRSRLSGAVLLAIPWLWSVRWSGSMSGGALGAASLGALFSFLLFSLSLGPGVDPARANALPGLVSLQVLASVLAVLYAFLSLPRLAWRIQFSIRRIAWRLVASHLLAGLIPVILAAAFLLLASALYLSTYRSTVAGRALWEASRNAERRIAAGLVNSGALPRDPFGVEIPGQVVVARENGGEARVLEGSIACDAESLLAAPHRPQETLLLWDGARLFLRAGLDTTLAGRRHVVEALAPLDSVRMATISGVIGVPVRVNPFVRVTRTQTGIMVGESDSLIEGTAIGPRRPGGLHLPGGAIVPCLFAMSDGWRTMVIPVISSASPGEMLTSLVTKSRENPLATVVLILLGLLAVLFLGAIWITTGMVIGMGRSIARTVRSLTEATRALREGKLEHRIRLEGQDELWSVAASFNEMAEGLERMRAVELERERLEEDLRLARDIQKRLLPPGPPAVDGVDLAGLSLPARHVGGDYFDYFALDGSAVGIVVADVAGKGVPAALLMSGFRASLRSEDLAALGPGRVLAHVNRFVCASVDPGKFITAFLGVLDARSGHFRYACAGHDPPVILARDGGVRELSEGGLLLGVSAEAAYEETSVELAPGATLAVFTDGVTEAQSPSEEFFGRERLVESLRGARGDSCARLLERIVAEIQRFAGTAPQYDDITLVLARRS